MADDTSPPSGDRPAGAIPPAGPAKRTGPSYVFLGVVASASLALDLVTKWWAKSHLEDPRAFPPKHLELVANHVQLVFARNKGGAWGILQGESASIRKPFFLAVSIAAVVFIVSLYRKLNPHQTALKWGLPLVLGGALGNLVDRIRYDHVVDFIDVFWKNQHWPTFNIADVAICVGVGLMAVDMFTSRKPSTPPRVEATERRADAEPSKGDDAERVDATTDAAAAGTAEGP